MNQAASFIHPACALVKASGCASPLIVLALNGRTSNWLCLNCSFKEPLRDLTRLSCGPCVLAVNKLNLSTPQELKRATFLCCPQSLLHADSLQRTHQSALQLQQRAELMLQAGHYDPDAVRACAETVALHWQTLMLKMEDRLKLVNASVAFYKTSEQVSCNRLSDGYCHCPQILVAVIVVENMNWWQSC